MMTHRRPKKRNPKARVEQSKKRMRCPECGKLLARSSITRHLKIHKSKGEKSAKHRPA